MPNTLAIGVAYSDQAISGGSIDATPIGAVTPSTVVGTVVLASEQIGYSASAQGVVTQLTDKSTAVTLNKSAGRITMNAASLATATNATFTLNNNLISANDTVILTISGGQATPGSYNVFANSLSAGSCSITLRNISGGSLAEAIVINFALLHSL
jgi:hypothetical protein